MTSLNDSELNNNESKILEIVKKELSCSAHDLDHVIRDYHMCIYLAESQDQVDLRILIPAVLLHDIARPREDADDSGSTDHALLGAEMAGEILSALDYSNDQIEKMKHCIVTHRYRGENVPQSLEAKILFDADKLDILGAVGLARSYMLAGQFKEKIFSNRPVDDYVRENLVGASPSGRIKDISKHSPNLEFETKQQRIPDRLFTDKAKQIAVDRIQFMEDYFQRLSQEISGLC